MTQDPKVLESLLRRLNIPEAFPKFKEMGVDRLFALRKLSDAQMREAVPDDSKRQALLEKINNRGSFQSQENSSQAPTTSVQTIPSTSLETNRFSQASYKRDDNKNTGEQGKFNNWQHEQKNLRFGDVRSNSNNNNTNVNNLYNNNDRDNNLEYTNNNYTNSNSNSGELLSFTNRNKDMSFHRSRNNDRGNFNNKNNNYDRNNNFNNFNKFNSSNNINMHYDNFSNNNNNSNENNFNNNRNFRGGNFHNNYNNNNNNNNNNNDGYGFRGMGRGVGRGFGRGGRGNNFNSVGINLGEINSMNINMNNKANSNNDNNNINTMTGEEKSLRPCRHHFSEEGCKFGEQCRYSHDESLRSAAETAMSAEAGQASQIAQQQRTREFLSAQYAFCEECEIPTNRIKYLIGKKGAGLQRIHELCETHNEHFNKVDDSKPTFTLRLYGNNREKVLRAKDMAQAAVGLKKEDEKKHRFQYAVNELNSNIHAVRYLLACNSKNKDTPNELSAALLRNVISTFRFVKPQEVHHYYMKTGTTDKDKFDIITKIMSQLQGVQAIVFCDQKRVPEMVSGAKRSSHYFNNVEPLFVHRNLTKEQRLETLEKFKNGVENNHGVIERLLVTSEDYAKLARKTIIPYVNVVIHMSAPRSEEFYVLQSLVTGRQGTAGASFLCIGHPSDEELLKGLQKRINFIQYVDEKSFEKTATQLEYDTVDHPLTLPNAEPLPDWREHLNDAKPKTVFNKGN